ncbi:alpha-(1-_6)-mannopyranosyltransferase A [Corynebacterium sp. sy039]|uniref:alpha-(1->6)-mannopyranosyltransferase A n=1 Tax=Corynebacterium sp. sy039 TaxID=2599641 RepID=UPI0011B4BF6B|nr:alpha-(1->6)-mannopyranosyltransferase A [Corynebacterium sp. sy039]QDZ42930.1 alpha-(1->6)-mannopyranosyltransferase A [Corynebacterium sp. sy039]
MHTLNHSSSVRKTATQPWWGQRLFRCFSHLSPYTLGIIASCIIMLSSFGAGATRNHGGILDRFGLNFFTFGHGSLICNVFLWIGIFLFVIAWLVLGRNLIHRNIEFPVTKIYRIMLWWVFPLSFASPLMSRDVYSYLMQGKLLEKGFDPYTQGAAANPGVYLVEVSPDWRNTTTPYGPLHLYLGSLITRVVGDNLTLGLFLFKIISLAGFALIAFSIARIALLFNVQPSYALWIGVLNPVVVFHLVGGMHNESVMVGLVSLGIYLALKNNLYLGIVIISIAMALKATAALALPFLIWLAVLRRDNLRQKILAFFISSITGVFLCLATLYIITMLSGATWGWIAELTGNTKVINPLAFPSFLSGIISSIFSVWIPDFPYNKVLAVIRLVSMAFLLIGVIASWIYFRTSKLAILRGVTVAYCCVFIFNSVTLPWYYASILTLFGVIHAPKWAKKLIIGFSIIIALSFTGGGNHQFYQPLWMIIVSILACWAVHWIFLTPYKHQGQQTTG